MLEPNSQAPKLDLPLTSGARFELKAQRPDTFSLLIFYRGSHCPVCKNYLESWAKHVDEVADRGMTIAAVCMDSEDRAMKVHEEWETGNVPLAYDMSEETAREWGLYISEKREGSEEPDVFSEPALFLIRNDGTIFFAQYQSAPFTRPPIDDLFKGIDFVIEEDYPARGTLT